MRAEGTSLGRGGRGSGTFWGWAPLSCVLWEMQEGGYGCRSWG